MHTYREMVMDRFPDKGPVARAPGCIAYVEYVDIFDRAIPC